MCHMWQTQVHTNFAQNRMRIGQERTIGMSLMVFVIRMHFDVVMSVLGRTVPYLLARLHENGDTDISLHGHGRQRMKSRLKEKLSVLN